MPEDFISDTVVMEDGDRSNNNKDDNDDAIMMTLMTNTMTTTVVWRTMMLETVVKTKIIIKRQVPDNYNSEDEYDNPVEGACCTFLSQSEELYWRSAISPHASARCAATDQYLKVNR